MMIVSIKGLAYYANEHEGRSDAWTVTRAKAEHEDPAIGTFLNLLEADIRKGKKIGALPKKLAQAMLANVGHADLSEDIEGEVTL